MYIKFLKLGVLLVAFLSCNFGDVEDSEIIEIPEVPIEKKIKVFLLAGQSNMDGRGDGGKLTEEDYEYLTKAQTNIQFAYNRNEITPLDITEPKNHIKEKFNLEKTFGPELFFGIEMAKKYPDEKFLFIKRSIGGTSLYGCWNPNWDAEKAALMGELDSPKLYSDLLLYMDEVLVDYDEDFYEFCGMLWVQGETDSGVNKYGPLPAESYGANLADLIAGVRAKIGVEDLPFLLLEVGNGKVVEGMIQVSEEVNNVTFIPQSKDENSDRYLPGYGPPVGHYNYECMKKIGEWLAEEFMNNYGIK